MSHFADWKRISLTVSATDMCRFVNKFTQVNGVSLKVGASQLPCVLLAAADLKDSDDPGSTSDRPEQTDPRSTPDRAQRSTLDRACLPARGDTCSAARSSGDTARPDRPLLTESADLPRKGRLRIERNNIVPDGRRPFFNLGLFIFLVSMIHVFL